MSLALQPLRELGRLMRAREVSPVELTEETLRRIEALDPKLNAYITVTADLALEQAQQAERELAEGRDRGPLHGIPYAAKDLCWTAGIRTTAGSKVLADFVPDEDATVVRKLREAGAVLIGKSGLHENAYGVTSTNPHFGAIRNAWALDRVPGGSSGGSATAQAAGLCGFSLGTDTGGSIRIPASFCGVTGLKPTFGRVSRYGIVPLGHTLDTVGPFAMSVEETAWAYQAMAGGDPRDDSSVDRDAPIPEFPRETSLDGVRIGVPENYYFEQLDEGVEAATRQALQDCESLGAELVGIRVPDIEEFNTLHRLILGAEASSVHERTLAERPEDYGPDQIAMLDLGSTVRAVDYLNAQRRRREIVDAFNAILLGVDVVAAPATSVPAGLIGAKTVTVRGRETDVRAASTRTTRALNLTGLPLLTMPCGFTPSGLPVGLQFVGRAFGEQELLAAGHAYQTATDWHRRRPPIADC